MEKETYNGIYKTLKDLLERKKISQEDINEFCEIDKTNTEQIQSYLVELANNNNDDDNNKNFDIEFIDDSVANELQDYITELDIDIREEKKTPILENIKINNINGLDIYYCIEQYGEEQSQDDRFMILDSSENYFNDFTLSEEDREEEIKGILKVLEQTTIEEMAYQYGYYLYDELEKICKALNTNENNLLDNEYVNRIVDTKNKKVWYCLKNDYRINDIEDIWGK